jgi:hypothetical protein
MNKIIKSALLTFSVSILFSSCISDNNNQDGYEVSLSASDLKYVPTTSNQLDDKAYMNEINTLLDDTAANIDNDPNFITLIKAIAWTESKWEHYFKKDNKYYVFLGDSGHSFGIMQIDDTYHGKHPVLQDNVEYGANYAYDQYLTARSDTCLSGTNSGSSLIAIARRTYAMYNGGSGAMCRDNDARDNSLEDALAGVWNNYL